jgi:CheY-like chemotaxis protein
MNHEEGPDSIVEFAKHTPSLPSFNCSRVLTDTYWRPPKLITIMAPLVLLVDDEPDQVEMYRLGLEASGFEVVHAYNGADAVTRARDHRPHAVVLDVRLPDMTGWEVCAALKADPRTEHIPIIILTAAARASLPQQAVAAGCASYLLKPCFPDELTRVVREVITPHLQA